MFLLIFCTERKVLVSTRMWKKEAGLFGLHNSFINNIEVFIRLFFDDFVKRENIRALIKCIFKSFRQHNKNKT